MDLSSQKLQAFVETARAGSVSAAAKTLALAQPSLSALLKKLERDFGTELFVRTQKGMTLTRAGRALLSRAEPLLVELGELKNVVREEVTEVRGRYTLGVYGALARIALPRFLPKLLRAHPKLAISLAHDTSRAIADGVVDLRYDFGLVVNAPRHPDLTVSELYADEVGLWCAASSKWHVSDPDVPIICSPAMLQAEIVLRQAVRSGLVKSTRLIHTSDLSVALALTAGGAGIGILPKTIAEAHAGARVLPVTRSPHHKDMICLIWRHDAGQSRGATTIKKAIVQGLKATGAERETTG